MKKAGEILKEMGFKAQGSDSVKEAFVRHLIKAATGHEVAPGPAERQELAAQGKHISPQQLSFDFTQETEALPEPTKKSS